MAKNKKSRKEEEFDKMVDEEELEENVYDEEDSYKSSEDFNLVSEVKALKILICVSICVAVLSLLLSLVILSKVSDGTSNEKNESSENNNGGNAAAEYDTSMFTEIDVDDFLDMYKGDGQYFVYTGRGTCGYCVAFLPYLQQSVSEYNYTLYYLDIDKVNKADLTEIAELHDKFAQTIGATPMVYFMGNKDVVDVNEGYTEYATYASFLEKNGITKRK